MHRLSLRLSDTLIASLRRELDGERLFRGNGYSLNDLCVRKLGMRVAAERHPGDGDTLLARPALVSRIPPPPLPPSPRAVEWAPRESAGEPQPERSAKPSEMVIPVIEDNTVSEWVAESAGVEDQHAEELTDLAIERMENEGNPDGHLDH